MNFQICGCSGNERVLEHYLGDKDLAGRDFLVDLCQCEAERKKFLKAVSMVDSQSPEQKVSPKVVMVFRRQQSSTPQRTASSSKSESGPDEATEGNNKISSRQSSPGLSEKNG